LKKPGDLRNILLYRKKETARDPRTETSAQVKSSGRKSNGVLREKEMGDEKGEGTGVTFLELWSQIEHKFCEERLQIIFRHIKGCQNITINQIALRKRDQPKGARKKTRDEIFKKAVNDESRCPSF